MVDTQGGKSEAKYDNEDCRVGGGSGWDKRGGSAVRGGNTTVCIGHGGVVAVLQVPDVQHCLLSACDERDAVKEIKCVPH